MREILKSQRGIALIVVLMVIAVLAAVIVEFSYSARVNLNIVANHKDELKAYYIARAGIEGSKVLLDYDKNKKVDYIVSAEDMDPETETWSQVKLITTTEFGGIPIGDGILVLGITDESSKININLLAYNCDDKGELSPKTDPDPKLASNLARARVIKLLENVLPDDIDAEPGDIANNIIDWIDNNDEGEAEDDYYQGLTPPYECKDAPINSISELKMIKGINDTIYEKIEKYFTPYGEKVNINTASYEVIQAVDLNDELSEEYRQMVMLSPSDPERGDHFSKPPTKPSKVFGVFSNYFSIRCIGVVNLGKKTEYSTTIKAIVKRNENPSGDIPPVEVLYWSVK